MHHLKPLFFVTRLPFSVKSTSKQYITYCCEHSLCYPKNNICSICGKSNTLFYSLSPHFTLLSSFLISSLFCRLRKRQTYFWHLSMRKIYQKPILCVSDIYHPRQHDMNVCSHFIHNKDVHVLPSCCVVADFPPIKTHKPLTSHHERAWKEAYCHTVKPSRRHTLTYIITAHAHL